MSDGNDIYIRALIHAIGDQLPPHLYAHFSIGLRKELANLKVYRHHGEYRRMILDTEPLLYEGENIRLFTLDDIEAIKAFMRCKLIQVIGLIPLCWIRGIT
jgi:hypothetical protein